MARLLGLFVVVSLGSPTSLIALPAQGWQRGALPVSLRGDAWTSPYSHLGVPAESGSRGRSPSNGPDVRAPMEGETPASRAIRQAASHEPPVFSPLPMRIQSVDGSIRVYASQTLDRLGLLRWAEESLARSEKLTGITRTRPGRVLRIAVEAGGGGREVGAAVSQHREGDGVVQVLRLDGVDGLERLVFDEALCQVAVWGYVLDQWEGVREGRDEDRWVSEQIPAATPTWLWQGLAGCLQPARRAEAADLVRRAWDHGRLEPLVPYLRRNGIPDPTAMGSGDPARRAAYATMLVGWLLELPERDARWDRLCGAIAAGDALTPEFLAATLPACATVVDLEDQWDRWLLAQERRIYTPGVTRASDLGRLREELILVRGVLGVPNRDPIPVQFGARELMAWRREAWVWAFGNAKALRLRTLALGRDDAFRHVVDSYAAYFDGLAAKARARTLRRLLATAEVAMADYEAAQPAGPPEPAPSLVR